LQSLSAARAGDYPQVDFRLSQFGTACGDPDVTGEGELTATAESEAVNGGNYGFFKVFDII